MRLHYALGQWDGEQIALIREKLKARWQVTIVDNIQKTVSRLLSLNFTKMDSLVWKLNIVAVSLTLAAELNLISSKSWNFEKAEAFDSSDLRRVGYS